jgi:hypothetical protein
VNAAQGQGQELHMRVHVRLAKNECGHDSGDVLVANPPVLVLGANLEVKGGPVRKNLTL